MRLMLLTAVTLCFAACSGCEEKKAEPAQAAAPAVTPAPTSPRQPTREELQAAVTDRRNLLQNPALRRFEPRTVTLNGKQVKMLPTNRLRTLRRGDLKPLPDQGTEATSSQPAATEGVQR